MMHDLLRRQRALEKTRVKFRGKPFAWGKSDCVVMARSHLIAMGAKRLPKLPRYKDALGARRALKGVGAESIEQMLDGLLPRISPAEMLPGDLAVVDGEGGMDAIMICVGHKIFGWHQASEKDEPVDVGSGQVNILSQIKAAYRG